MNYEKLILDKLLDKYEKSKSFAGESSNRRIMLKILAGEVTEYDIEKPLVRETFNSAIQDLAGKGLIEFSWLKYEKGNIIEKVWLNISNVNLSYALIGRKAKRDSLETILEYATKLLENGPQGWITDFLRGIEIKIKNCHSISGLLPSDEEQAMAILRAMEGIQKLKGGDILERVFSLYTFGDTKYFEKNIRHRVVKIIKGYCIDAETQGEIADEEALAEVGILKSPQQVEFRGGFLGKIGERHVDFSAFPYGVSINSDTVKKLTFLNMWDISKIVFIENKANYVDFVAKSKNFSVMAVFHGGFYGSLKEIFFEKLYAAAASNGTVLYHWGDIDLGGFLMFARLKANIIPGLKSYLMDSKALMSRVQFASSFDVKYAKRLEALLGDERFAEFWDVIKVMLDRGIRLEQEAFLRVL